MQYYANKFWSKSKWVHVDSMDFYSGSRVEEEDEEEDKPRNFIEKIWAAIM